MFEKRNYSSAVNYSLQSWKDEWIAVINVVYKPDAVPLPLAMTRSCQNIIILVEWLRMIPDRDQTQVMRCW